MYQEPDEIRLICGALLKDRKRLFKTRIIEITQYNKNKLLEICNSRTIKEESDHAQFNINIDFLDSIPYSDLIDIKFTPNFRTIDEGFVSLKETVLREEQFFERRQVLYQEVQ